jgi:hypothetical protein
MNPSGHVCKLVDSGRTEPVGGWGCGKECWHGEVRTVMNW